MISLRSIAGISVFLLLLSLCATSVLAGTTGKITGQVLDKETREPLIGANIVIEGTLLGGNTDIYGNFTILNVPPGTYRIRATMVGYGATTISDARVNIDQTTRINVELAQEAVQVGEQIIIAPRDILRNDVSTSQASFTSDEVTALPVASVTQVLGLQAGVETGANGQLVIRGGGADQSLFLVDGVTMRDPRTNLPISGIPMSAVKEVSIERGGFTAEYGQLRSGIINIVSKEGNVDKYNLSFTVRYQPYAHKYFGDSPYDANSYYLRPYLDDAVCWTGTTNGAWDPYIQRQYPKFGGWDSVSTSLLTNNDPNDNLSPAAAQRLFRYHHRQTQPKSPDYNIDAGFGGRIPYIGKYLGNLRFFVSYRNLSEMYSVPLTRDNYYEENWSLRMTSDISPKMKLDISSSYNRSNNVVQNGNGGNQAATITTSYIHTPDEVSQYLFNLGAASGIEQAATVVFANSYLCLANVTHRTAAVQFTNMISSDAFYDLRAEYVSGAYDAGPAAPRNMDKTYELFPGYFVDEGPFGYSYISDQQSQLAFGGHTANTRDASRISSMTLKGNITAQMNIHNQVKGGFEFVYNTLDMNYGILEPQWPDLSQSTKMKTNPMRAALYAEDKIEYEGFIANLGLRVDYSNANASWYAGNAYNVGYFETYNPNASYDMEKPKAKLQLSPRISISHPITENSKLFFNYGHFQQLPTYEGLLRLDRSTNKAVQTIGNPNLEMESTVAYELGFDYILFENFLLQMSGFYRDISNEAVNITYRSLGDWSYNQLQNVRYSDIRGFEVTLRKTSGLWWNGQVNFTYQVTTSGQFGSNTKFESPLAQITYDRRTALLYQQRPSPSPYARANLYFFTPDDFGPKFAGQRLLASWGLNTIFDWRDGGYTTYDPANRQDVNNNVKIVNYYNLNLRFTKAFTVGKAKLQLFVDVQNVLNTKRLNLNSFTDNYDFNFYMQSLHLPKDIHYTNIEGTDKYGDYRKEGVDFRPIERVGSLEGVVPVERAVYYNTNDGKYWYYRNSQWGEVPSNEMSQILDDKAYIDMPNNTSFWFLNPRNLFFGATFSIEL